MDPILSGTVEFLQWLINLPMQGYTNFTRNAVEMWDGMTLFKYIRLVAILGGYLLLRPYLQKWGEKIQKKQFEKELDTSELDAKDKKAKISPNALRGAGGKTVSFEDESEEEEGKASGANWGKKARKRQRAFVKKVLDDEEEKRRVEQEDEEDKDILEYLVDYEEGKDGW